MKKIKKILAKVVACTMIFAVAIAGISLIKGKEASAAVTKTAINSIKWEFDVSGLTDETQIVWSDGSNNYPITVNGDGAYSVTVNYSSAEGLQNMGFFQFVDGSPVTASVSKVTVNGTYVFTTYSQTFRIGDGNNNGAPNVWWYNWNTNAVDTDIMTSDNAKIMYSVANDLIEFYAEPNNTETTTEDESESESETGGDSSDVEIALYIGGVEAAKTAINGDGTYTINFQGNPLSAGQWGTMYIKQIGTTPTFEGKGVKLLKIVLNGEDYEIPSAWTTINGAAVDNDDKVFDVSFYNQWASDKNTMNIGDKTGLDLADLQVTQAEIQFEIGDADVADGGTTAEETTTANGNPGAGVSGHTTAYALIIVGAVAACAAVVLAGKKKVEER